MLCFLLPSPNPQGVFSAIYLGIYLNSWSKFPNFVGAPSVTGPPRVFSLSDLTIVSLQQLISCILDPIYKWDHMVFVFLSSHSMIISSCIHVAANGIISFFLLWLSCIPLYICTTTLSIHLSMDIYIVFLSCLLWIVVLFFDFLYFENDMPRVFGERSLGWGIYPALCTLSFLELWFGVWH